MNFTLKTTVDPANNISADLPVISKEKDIPCLIRLGHKGSITSEILVDIVTTLDHLEVMDRSTGHELVLFVDGHGSRFGMLFLAYVINEAHP